MVSTNQSVGLHVVSRGFITLLHLCNDIPVMFAIVHSQIIFGIIKEGIMYTEEKSGTTKEPERARTSLYARPVSG